MKRYYTFSQFLIFFLFLAYSGLGIAACQSGWVDDGTNTGKCVQSCTSSGDCKALLTSCYADTTVAAPLDKVCEAGKCKYKENTTPPAATEGDPCTGSSCGTGLSCTSTPKGNYCLKACTSSSPCDGGRACLSGYCAVVFDDSDLCNPVYNGKTYPVVCKTPAGTLGVSTCVAGQCVLQCRTDADCDDNVSTTADSCIKSTGLCRHVPTTCYSSS